MKTLTAQEKERISAENAKRFVYENSDYYGSPMNSVKMQAHLDTQVGRNYPWSVENYLAAWEFLRFLPDWEVRPPSADAIAAKRKHGQEIHDSQLSAIRKQSEDVNSNDPATVARKKRLELANLSIDEQKKLPSSVLRQLATDTRVEELEARGLSLREVQDRRYE